MWAKLSDLADLTHKVYTKSLKVRPLQRPYLTLSGVVYDYHVGHEFVVDDQSSPINNCRITVCDKDTLRRSYDITHLSIKFNPGLDAVEVAL